jgi:hypothetical protein
MICRHIHLLRRRPLAGGFTMVELLAAMSVTLLMVVFFLGFTANGLNHWNRAAGKMATETQDLVIMDYLEQDLGSAYFRRDGRVWLAATIQPDQIGAGDTHGVSDSTSNPSGLTLKYTGWTAGLGGNMKPPGQTAPYTPNASGSSLFIPPYLPPTTATQSSLTSSATTNSPSNLPNLSAFRFGQAGVWLRLFTPVPDSNDGQSKNAQVLRAVSYQIVRMKTSDNSTSYRYHLMRSSVRPYGTTATSQARSTFGAGHDFFQAFTTTTVSTGTGGVHTVHTATTSIYNNPSNTPGNPQGLGSNGGGGGLAQDDAGNIRQPNINQVIADNVIDFGVLVWGRTFDPNNGREMNVLLFPASSDPVGRPNLGFAVTTEDGFTRTRDELGNAITAIQPPQPSSSSYTGWGANGLENLNAMTYGFAFNPNGLPGPPSRGNNDPLNLANGRPCTPAFVDVFVRILDEEGARLIDQYENAPPGTPVIALPAGVSAAENWWRIAEQHSHIYTRRIQLLNTPM